MGALRSKGCRDASGTKPLNALLSHEEAGNRTSLALKATTARVRHRARQSADAGRSREQSPITVERVNRLTRVSQPAIITAGEPAQRASRELCHYSLLSSIYKSLCARRHVGTPIAVWQHRPVLKGALWVHGKILCPIFDPHRSHSTDA